MATSKKSYEIPGVGLVEVQKKSRSTRLSLRINSHGAAVVSIPTYIPFEAGRRFAYAQADWIRQHSKPRFVLKVPGRYQLYDATEVLVEWTNGRNSTSLSAGAMKLKLNQEAEAPDKYVMSAVKKFLAHDTKNVVEPLVAEYAAKIGNQPSAVKFKSTTSKWGSCNSQKVLVFSSYMAQLPNDLIRYVVIHELCHISNMNHSPQFWELVAQFDADYKAHRKALKSYELRPFIKNMSTMDKNLA